jgi:hypothetical protein
MFNYMTAHSWLLAASQQNAWQLFHPTPMAVGFIIKPTEKLIKSLHLYAWNTEWTCSKFHIQEFY